MKAFKQRAWLYVVVGVAVVFFFIVAPRLGEQATEIDMDELSPADAEHVVCNVCGEKAVIFSLEAEKMCAWCALHVPPQHAMCMVCGAQGAPLWRRQDGQIVPFCEKHLPTTGQWKRVTFPQPEQEADAADVAGD
ncbi:MAG: hypothetical protein JSU68_09260 [Phycisphaerales bacterium]|nr:MAG: hypothetical protein JSU68_09260 [Phycisphaerales bacterium]